VLFIVGLVIGYFAGVGLEHNLTVLNIISHITNYLTEAVIAIAFVVAGGSMAIFGSKKSNWTSILKHLFSPITFPLALGFLSKAFSLTFHHLYSLGGKALG
jgi:predicted permease